MDQNRICTAVLHYLNRKPLAAEKQVERRKALDSDTTLAFPLWQENSNLSKNKELFIYSICHIYIIQYVKKISLI